MMNQNNTYREFITKQGVTTFIRHIHPDEAHLLVDLFAHMSSESRYQRFLQPVDHVSQTRIWQEATRIAERNALGDVCLVAFTQVAAAGEKLTAVAAARYVLLSPAQAEIAMSVRDEFQGQGIGKHMLQLLVKEARRANIQELVATVQNDNEIIWHLLNSLELPLTRTVEGTASYITLTLPEPSRVA